MGTVRAEDLQLKISDSAESAINILDDEITETKRDLKTFKGDQDQNNIIYELEIKILTAKSKSLDQRTKKISILTAILVCMIAALYIATGVLISQVVKQGQELDQIKAEIIQEEVGE